MPKTATKKKKKPNTKTSAYDDMVEDDEIEDIEESKPKKKQKKKDTEFKLTERKLKLQVPGAIRPPKVSLNGQMLWLYGEPKIGKTTFANNFNGVWFIATEPGQDWIPTREPTIVNDWDEFLTLCEFIEDTKPTEFGDGTPINTLVIDTVDILYRMCFEAICDDLGVDDPGELPHGKGWSKLNVEFDSVMSKIRRWPYTLIVISHAKQLEFKTKGRKVDKYVPSIGAAGFRWCQGSADIILFAHSRESAEKDRNGDITGRIIEERVMLCHPQSWAMAGGRMSDKLPEILPLSHDELLNALKDNAND